MFSPSHDGQRSPTEISQRVLVTYFRANGGKESVLVGLTSSYESFLQDACTSLDRHIPSNWRNIRKDFARQVRDRQGRIVWAPIEPDILLELGQLNQLPPELRLRMHLSEDDADASPSDRRSIDTRIPAYEAIQGDGALNDRIDYPTPVSYSARDNAPGQYGLAGILRTSSASYLAKDYKNTIKSLRTACDNAQDVAQRAKILLWIGQISYELKEYHNAASDLTISCDIFKGSGDHDNRLECELMHARILRARNSGSDVTPLLSGLLQDAQTNDARIAEVHILYDLCEIACGASNLTDAASRAEHIKVVAQETGDLWCKATESRALGMINEAGQDFVIALETYSRALGMYVGAAPRSPISPIKDVEVAIQRMRYNLSIPMTPSQSDWQDQFRDFVTTKTKIAREYLERRRRV